MSDSQATGKKSRGRKSIETNKYIKDSRKKITEWQEQLKKNPTKEERHSLRNKISALESRIQKR